jgi:hypothetical protein
MESAMPTAQRIAAQASNGYRCDACGHLFPLIAAVEREVHVLADSMYGRPSRPIRQLEACCPNCDSAELTPVSLCDHCHQALALAGSDFCEPCDALTEREAHEAYMRRCREQRHADFAQMLAGIARVQL